MAGQFDPNTAVLVAVIIAPHGVAGNVSAECLSDNPRRFVVDAKFVDENQNIYTLQTASMHKGRLLLHFAGVNDRDGAEKLRGIKLYITPSPADTLPNGVYYHYQLTGLKVREAGIELGTIVDIHSHAANDLLIVKNEQGEEILRGNGLGLLPHPKGDGPFQHPDQDRRC